MRWLIAVLTTLALWVSASSADVFVNGYYRRDGTYVRPHYRSNPDGNFWNNWTTYPNVNPYTGRPGTLMEPPAARERFTIPILPRTERQERAPSASNKERPARGPLPTSEPRRGKVKDYVELSDEEKADRKLKLVELLIAHKDKEGAEFYLKNIIRTLPKTKAAEKAKELLDSLKPSPIL